MLNEWKITYMSSIHKKDNKKNRNNYREISVTNTMSKLYDRILRDFTEAESK